MEVCGHHLHTTPVPPSDRLGRALPAALEAWVLACLAKDPAQRPQTAAQAVAALERCAIPSWTDDLARSWWLSKGRALRADRSHEVLPSDMTVSRPVLNPMGG
jgi:serine/threonine-protein kinase